MTVGKIGTQVLPKSCAVFSGPNQGEMFLWMPKEHLYVLVYLVTVMHSMQAGYMEKAQKYTDKALMQIEKLQSMFSYKNIDSSD